MEAGTWVALVLGVVGFALSAFTLVTNSRSDREKRWLQEKRLIYVRARATLNDLLDAETALINARVGEADRDAALEADNAAWLRMNEVHAELDLLAPDAVRQAVDAADEALSEVGATLIFGGDRQPQQDAVNVAGNLCLAALDAMRADLGVEPSPWTRRNRPETRPSAR